MQSRAGLMGEQTSEYLIHQWRVHPGALLCSICGGGLNVEVRVLLLVSAVAAALELHLAVSSVIVHPKKLPRKSVTFEHSLWI